MWNVLEPAALSLNDLKECDFFVTLEIFMIIKS